MTMLQLATYKALLEYKQQTSAQNIICISTTGKQSCSFKKVKLRFKDNMTENNRSSKKRWSSNT